LANLFGVIFGLLGMTDRDRRIVFAVWGLILNSLALLTWAASVVFYNPS